MNTLQKASALLICCLVQCGCGKPREGAAPKTRVATRTKTPHAVPPKRSAEEAAKAGVGLTLKDKDGKLLVGRVLPDTPAERSHGIHADDQVLAIAEAGQDPVEVTGKKMTDVVAMIRGTKGSTLRLTILPAGKEASAAVVVSLVRGNIKELDFFGDGKRLPVGTAAPNFQFTRLSDGQAGDLAALGGRIVIVDVWATWCGPCVRALDKWQTMMSDHPQWQGRVEFLAVSADETQAEAARLFAEKKWSGFTTVWAGPAVMQAYHVAALPTVYVVDAQGKIATGDSILSIADVVAPLIEKPAAP